MIPLRLSGAGYRSAAVAIVSPASETNAVIGRSNVGQVDLGKAMRSDILRKIGADRGLSRPSRLRSLGIWARDERERSDLRGPEIRGP